jgi:hypothetical protein
VTSVEPVACDTAASAIQAIKSRFKEKQRQINFQDSRRGVLTGAKSEAECNGLMQWPYYIPHAKGHTPNILVINFVLSS